MAIDISENLRSDEGKRRGGRTRAIGETAWGMVDPATAKNATGRGEPYQVIGSHAPAPARLGASASEGNPHGLAPAAPRARVAAQPAGMKGRR